MSPKNMGLGQVDKRRIVAGEDFTLKGGSPNAGISEERHAEHLAVQYKTHWCGCLKAAAAASRAALRRAAR